MAGFYAFVILNVKKIKKSKIFRKFVRKSFDFQIFIHYNRSVSFRTNFLICELATVF